MKGAENSPLKIPSHLRASSTDSSAAMKGAENSPLKLDDDSFCPASPVLRVAAMKGAENSPLKQAADIVKAETDLGRRNEGSGEFSAQASQQAAPCPPPTWRSRNEGSGEFSAQANMIWGSCASAMSSPQ